MSSYSVCLAAHIKLKWIFFERKLTRQVCCEVTSVYVTLWKKHYILFINTAIDNVSLSFQHCMHFLFVRWDGLLVCLYNNLILYQCSQYSVRWMCNVRWRKWRNWNQPCKHLYSPYWILAEDIDVRWNMWLYSKWSMSMHNGI